MRKNRRRLSYVRKKGAQKNAEPIPPWYYTGCEIIVLNDEDWWEPPPEEEPIPA